MTHTMAAPLPYCPSDRPTHNPASYGMRGIRWNTPGGCSGGLLAALLLAALTTACTRTLTPVPTPADIYGQQLALDATQSALNITQTAIPAATEQARADTLATREHALWTLNITGTQLAYEATEQSIAATATRLPLVAAAEVVSVTQQAQSTTIAATEQSALKTESAPATVAARETRTAFDSARNQSELHLYDAAQLVLCGVGFVVMAGLLFVCGGLGLALYQRARRPPAIIIAEAEADYKRALADDLEFQRQRSQWVHAPEQLAISAPTSAAFSAPMAYDPTTPSARLAAFLDLCISQYGGAYPRIPPADKLKSPGGTKLSGDLWQPNVDDLKALGVVYATTTGTFIKHPLRTLNNLRHWVAGQAMHIDEMLGKAAEVGEVD